MSTPKYLYHGSPRKLEGKHLDPAQADFIPYLDIEKFLFATDNPLLAFAFGCKQYETHTGLDAEQLRELLKNKSLEDEAASSTLKPKTVRILKGTFKRFGYLDDAGKELAVVADVPPSPEYPVYLHTVSSDAFTKLPQDENPFTFVPIWKTGKAVEAAQTREIHTIDEAMRDGLNVFYFNPETKLETMRNENGEFHTLTLKLSEMSDGERAFATGAKFNEASQQAYTKEYERRHGTPPPPVYDGNEVNLPETDVQKASFKHAIAALMEEGVLLSLNREKGISPQDNAGSIIHASRAKPVDRTRRSSSGQNNIRL